MSTSWVTRFVPKRHVQSRTILSLNQRVLWKRTWIFLEITYSVSNKSPRVAGPGNWVSSLGSLAFEDCESLCQHLLKEKSQAELQETSLLEEVLFKAKPAFKAYECRLKAGRGKSKEATPNYVLIVGVPEYVEVAAMPKRSRFAIFECRVGRPPGN